jgi:hypothetical protein
MDGKSHENAYSARVCHDFSKHLMPRSQGIVLEQGKKKNHAESAESSVKNKAVSADPDDSA